MNNSADNNNNNSLYVGTCNCSLTQMLTYKKCFAAEHAKIEFWIRTSFQTSCKKLYHDALINEKLFEVVNREIICDYLNLFYN